MSNISNKEAALLGLLSEKPKHAYEIKLDIENRSMDYWTEISQSSIYKLLNKLEKDSLVKSKIKLTKKNISKKIYSITKNGTEQFRYKLKELVSDWQPSVHPIDVALKNLNLIDNKEAIACLKKYQSSLDETIKGYHDLEIYLEEHHAHLANMQLATRRIYMLKGEKEWIENFINEYAKE